MEKILPEIIARKGTSKCLNMWCGASSSGQEPYSVMFTIFEHFPELKGLGDSIYCHGYFRRDA